MKIYKKQMSWTPYIYIISVICLITLLKVISPSNYFDISILMYVLIGIQLFIILFIHWIKYNSQFIIKENSIIAKGFLKTQEIRFNEIIGYEKKYWQSTYSETLKYVVLKSNNEAYGNIKIHPSYINFIELQEWIETNFTDLDLVLEKKKWNRVLDSEKFGSNKFSRTVFVKQAKKVADILNYSAMLLLLFLFFPSTHSYILIPALIIPILSISAIFYFKGIIRLNNHKSKKPKTTVYNPSVFTNVFLAICLPALLLFTIFYTHYNIIDYNSLWKIALIISSLLFLLSLVVTKEFEYNKIKSYINLSIVFLFLFGYSFFGIIGINCAFDNSIPIKATGIVTKIPKSTSNKIHKYVLEIKSPELDDLIKIKVKKEIYEGVDNGSEFTYIIRNGLFDIQYISVIE